MATVTKFANANTVVTTGFTNASNAYADDGSYATAAPGKNSDVVTDYGFPAFSTADIPDGATITQLATEVQYKSSTTSSANAAIGLQHSNQGTLLNSETTAGMSLADALVVRTDSDTTGVINVADLRSANQLKARVRAHRAASNTAITWSIDYVKLTVAYTAAAPIVTADTSVTGTGTVSPDASALRGVDAAITGSGSGAPCAGVIASASVDGQPTATVSPSATVISSGIAVDTTVTGTGSVAPAASVLRGVATNVSGTATEAPSAGAIRGVTTSVSGTATVAPTGVVLRGVQAVVTAAGSLTAAASRLVGAVTSVIGSGTVHPSVAGSRKQPPKGTASMMGLGV